jgi:hypothetical protein
MTGSEDLHEVCSPFLAASSTEVIFHTTRRLDELANHPETVPLTLQMIRTSHDDSIGQFAIISLSHKKML